MADPIKVPTYEDEQEHNQLQPKPVERRASERRSGRERAAGFFRERPYAKWVLLTVIAVIVVGGIFIWHYYSVRESTDDAQIDGHIDPISSRVSGTVLRVQVDAEFHGWHGVRSYIPTFPSAPAVCGRSKNVGM